MSGDTAGEAVEVVRALANVSGVFRTIAAGMRRREDVTSVTEVCWMQPQQHRDELGVSYGDGDGVGVEWYADGEFTDGRALSFGLELGWEAGLWMMEAAIRVTVREGQRMLVELPRRRATGSRQLPIELAALCQDLLASQDEGLRRFLETP